MKLRNSISVIFTFLIVLISCSKNSDTYSAYSSPDEVSSTEGQGAGRASNKPGQITAGEWNDLENWNFWDSLMLKKDFKSYSVYWSLFNNSRISVSVTDPEGEPAVNVSVKLKRNGTVIFSARTDNKGKAALWADLFQYSLASDLSALQLDLNNGASIVTGVKLHKEGINSLTLTPPNVNNRIELAFAVDATGSMGDELEFLKTELLDVLGRVKEDNPNADVYTSAVFYRDEGDDYLTRVSNFTSTGSKTVSFIKQQSANGGGDFPEAVHSALDKAVNELQWSENAKTRLLFLLLDAPPHHNDAVIKDIQNSVQQAASKGIKIIPVAASGVDKETEFLLRFLAMSTNGTYVFITNHSGIGNTHLEASVGKYQVELLNNLMVRLIDKYAK